MDRFKDFAAQATTVVQPFRGGKNNEDHYRRRNSDRGGSYCGLSTSGRLRGKSIFCEILRQTD
jgi:hypothetical protein